MKLITKHNPFSNAFTLAEVLITLTIIGVVAAMTMPTLINNTNGAQFKTAYKKALSVLNQAVVMNIALVDYDFAGTSANADEDKDIASLYSIFDQRTNGSWISNVDKVDDEGTPIENSSDLAGYVTKIGTIDTTDFDDDAKTALSSITPSNYVAKRFMDNTMVLFDKTQANCTEENPCFGFIDANGEKTPNKVVTCTVSDNECTSKVTINDIFPIKFYDQTVAPASASARAVLYGSENEEATTASDDDNEAP